MDRSWISFSFLNFFFEFGIRILNLKISRFLEVVLRFSFQVEFLF